MAGTQITNIATKQDLMCGANHLNVAYSGGGDDYTVSGMIECAGAWYRFVDEPLTVTTSDYIKMIPVIGATPGTNTATLAAITSFSGVAFDTDKNGYYVTGTSERVFAYRDPIITGELQIGIYFIDPPNTFNKYSPFPFGDSKFEQSDTGAITLPLLGLPGQMQLIKYTNSSTSKTISTPATEDALYEIFVYISGSLLDRYCVLGASEVVYTGTYSVTIAYKRIR